MCRGIDDGVGEECPGICPGGIGEGIGDEGVGDIGEDEPDPDGDAGDAGGAMPEEGRADPAPTPALAPAGAFAAAGAWASVRSTSDAAIAFDRIDSMPPIAAAFDSYASPTAMICPLPDFRRNRYLPRLSL